MKIPKGLKRGTIIGFYGSWQSGLATLLLKNSKGHQVTIHCENAPTVRALDAAFGNVIDEGHCVNVDAIRNREILYAVNDFGILEGFAPVEEIAK